MKRKQTFHRVRLKAEAVWGTAEPPQSDPERTGPAHRRSSGYLSQLVNGERCPSPETRRRLMRVLGVSDFDVLFVMERVGA